MPKYIKITVWRVAMATTYAPACNNVSGRKDMCATSSELIHWFHDTHSKVNEMALVGLNEVAHVI